MNLFALSAAVTPRLLLPCLLFLVSVGASQVVLGTMHHFDMRAFRPGRKR